jgi:hypothetical protein
LRALALALPPLGACSRSCRLQHNDSQHIVLLFSLLSMLCILSVMITMVGPVMAV